MSERKEISQRSPEFRRGPALAGARMSEHALDLRCRNGWQLTVRLSLGLSCGVPQRRGNRGAERAMIDARERILYPEPPKFHLTWAGNWAIFLNHFN